MSSTKYSAHTDLGSLSREELVVEHSKLEEKYRKLRSQFSDSVAANELLQKQLRENIQSREKWAQHAKDLETQSNARKQKIEKLKAKLSAVSHLGVGVDSSFAPETHSLAENEHNWKERRLEQPAVDYTGASALWPPEVLDDTNRESSALGGTDDTERAPSLPPLPQSRNVAPEQHRPTEPSSDTPVIIAERSVRKRRRNDETSVQTPAATRIKLEDSSDPVVTSEQRNFSAHESVDFDNAEDMVETPRKIRTRATHSTSRAAPPTNARSHPVPQDDTSSAENQTADKFDQHDSMSAHVQERDQAAARWRETIQEDEYTTEMDYDEPVDRSSALHPYDRAEPKATARKPKSQTIITSALRKGIASLAEDGNAVGSNLKARGRVSAKSGRLANLLNTVASPEREAINLHSDRRAREMLTSHAAHLTMPPKRTLPFQQPESSAHQVPNALLTPLTNKSNRTPSATKVDMTRLDAPDKHKPQGNIPLRKRPSWSLNRSDFKLNPKYNEGYDYAFGDVVRGRARASLPGCSKEECCGKLFRPLAQAQLPETGHIAFTSLLESYLGDEAGKLGSMTKDEKENMWIEAKIKELSDKHGKHRERHSGMREPPGWDRMGFPSTQEEQEDREAANRLELDEVELRYREAIKKGKYLFRDEEP